MKSKVNILILSFMLLLVFVFTACGNNAAKTKDEGSRTESKLPASMGSSNLNRKILIAYFSHTGTTENAALKIQELVGGDMVKIEVAVPYPEDNQELVKVTEQEMKDNARPELSTSLENIDEYDIVFIGYPIWWHTTPMAVYTFLESYDLSGKIVIPFCTSSNSDIEESMEAINSLCKNSTILEGLTVNNIEDIQPWLTKIGMLK